MDLKEPYVKLFILMIIPTLIIALILFIIEFSIAVEPPYLSLVGFVFLIGSGGFIYFTNMKKLKEEKDKKEAIKGYLVFMVPTIVISTILFTLVDPPKPPYLLVYGLVVYLIAYTGIYFLAMKSELG